MDVVIRTSSENSVLFTKRDRVEFDTTKRKPAYKCDGQEDLYSSPLLGTSAFLIAWNKENNAYTLAYLAQLGEHWTAVREVEGSSSTPDVHSAS